MKIEIWSDVACPFCYIGKRHLEKAIEVLPFKDELEIIWKSYQLSPGYNNTNNESIYDHLSNSKGISPADAKLMIGQIEDMASLAGLKMSFDHIIPANTFDAHRLIHLAATHKLQNEAKEALLKAYFLEGIDVADKLQLALLGERTGLDKKDVVEMFQGDKFSDNVKLEIKESQDLGIQGVPFFVLDRKYAISGAQPVQAFIDALKQSYKEWQEVKQDVTLKLLKKEKGAICDESGCDI